MQKGMSTIRPTAADSAAHASRRNDRSLSPVTVASRAEGHGCRVFTASDDPREHIGIPKAYTRYGALLADTDV